MAVIRPLVRLLIADDMEAAVHSFRHGIMGTLHSVFGHNAFSKTFPGGPLVELVLWTFNKEDPRFAAKWSEPPLTRRSDPLAFLTWGIKEWAKDVSEVIIRDYDPTFLMLDVDLSAYSPLSSEGSGIGSVGQAGAQDTAEGAFIGVALADRKLAGQAGRLQSVWLYSGFGPSVVFPVREWALPIMNKAGLKADLKFKSLLPSEDISRELRRNFEAARLDELSNNNELREILGTVLKEARGCGRLDPEVQVGTITAGDSIVLIRDLFPEVLKVGISEAQKIAKLEQVLGIDLSEACSVAYNCYGVRVLTHSVRDWTGARDRIGVSFEEEDLEAKIASGLAESERLNMLFGLLGPKEISYIKGIWLDPHGQFVPEVIMAVLGDLKSNASSLENEISEKLYEYRTKHCKDPHQVGQILEAMTTIGFDRSPLHLQRRTEDLETVYGDDLFHLYWPFLREGKERTEGLFAEPLRNLRSWAKRIGFDSFCDFVSLPDARKLDSREKNWVDLRSRENFLWYDDITDLVTWIHCFCLGFLPVQGRQARFELHRFDLTAFSDISGALPFDFRELLSVFGRMLVLNQNGKRVLASGRDLSDVVEGTEDARIGKAIAVRFKDVIQDGNGGIICFCFKTCTQFSQGGGLA
ncbi:MAG TPA: hypothetical protein VLB76_29390 [Thermoanaerobaculia bacterium]|nr:hypothetical protein [Thermoanaerobaculia bacterium]